MGITSRDGAAVVIGYYAVARFGGACDAVTNTSFRLATRRCGGWRPREPKSDKEEASTRLARCSRHTSTEEQWLEGVGMSAIDAEGVRLGLGTYYILYADYYY